MSNWIDLGGMEFCVISGGRFRLDGGGMFGIIPKVLWEKHDPPDERNRILLDANCVLVRSAGQIALIDTGNGGKLNLKERDIFALEDGHSLGASLAEVGIGTADVNVVILSHLHMDHAGGASEWAEPGIARFLFERARCVVQRGEWEDALANRSTMRVSYRPENLQPLQDSGRLELLAGSAEILPGVHVQVVPGHTPHHQMIHLVGSRRHAVFAGDVLPTWSHLRLPYNMAYDLCPHQNMLAKEQLLKDASADRWLIIPTHDPRLPVGIVEEVGEGKFMVGEVGK